MIMYFEIIVLCYCVYICFIVFVPRGVLFDVIRSHEFARRLEKLFDLCLGGDFVSQLMS